MPPSKEKATKRSRAAESTAWATASARELYHQWMDQRTIRTLQGTIKAAAKAQQILEGYIGKDFLLGRASNSLTLIEGFDEEEEEEEEEKDEDEAGHENPGELLNEASKSVFYVTGRSRKKESGVLLNSKDICDWSIDDLRKDAIPSTYGDMLEGTTKVDSTVRKALEIPRKTNHSSATGLETKSGDFPFPWLRECQSRIEEDLFDGKPIELKLNKLNIYEQGGFFSRHVDTPAENVVGTLLIVLNKFPFRGGEFRLGNGVEIGGSSLDRCGEGGGSQDDLTFIAFYADVPHSVERVKEGHRVTLSFYITKGKEWNTTVPKTYQDLVKRNNKLYEKVLKGLLNKHDEFGILLGHQYSIYETDEKGADQPLLSVTKMLKEQLLLDFEIHSVVLKHEESLYANEGYREKVVEVFRCDSEDWNYLVGATMKKPNPTHQIPIYHCGGPYGETLHEFGEPYLEYTGNEAQPEVKRNVYFSRVVVIRK